MPPLHTLHLHSQQGIATLALESPFYGERKPPHQQGAKLHHVSDLLLLGRATIEESLLLLHWLRRQGHERLGERGGGGGGRVGAWLRCLGGGVSARVHACQGLPAAASCGESPAARAPAPPPRRPSTPPRTPCCQASRDCPWGGCTPPWWPPYTQDQSASPRCWRRARQRGPTAAARSTMQPTGTRLWRVSAEGLEGGGGGGGKGGGGVL